MIDREATTKPHGGAPVDAQLVVLVGGHVGQRFMVGDGVVIGRDESNEVEVGDPGVSRHHAKIVRSPPGTYLIEDLGSSNGTVLNGVQIERAPLHFGDKFALGSDTVFLFLRHGTFEDQLQQAHRLQILGQLAAGVSHDFNNILGAVLANVTDVRNPEKSEEGHDPDQCLEDIEVAARRGAELTRQLLEFVQSSDSEPKPVDLPELLSESQRLLRRVLPRTIDFDWNVEPNLVVIGPRTQLLQVIMNLCVNAGDAMPSGGTLTVTADSTRLRVAPREDPLLPGEYVRLVVEDTGVGMDAVTLEQVFQPFFTTKGRGRGTGLGLSIVNEIVRSLGGRVGVTSELGAGTRATVHLPLVHRELVETTPLVKKASTKRLDGVVLLVEDEPSVQAALQRALRRAGLEVLLAANGSAALDVYAESRDRIQLVVLDLDMPEMDGREALQRLRALDPDVRVLISSGMVGADVEDELRGMGASAVLSKPYGTRELRDAVASVLSEPG